MFFGKDVIAKIRFALVRFTLWALVAMRSGFKFVGNSIIRVIVFLFQPIFTIFLVLLRPFVRWYLRLLRFSRESGVFLNQYFSYMIVAIVLVFGVTGNILAEEVKTAHDTTSRIFDSLLSNYDQDVLITEEGLVVPEQEIRTSYIAKEGLLRSDIGLPLQEQEKLIFELPVSSVFEEDYLRPSFEGVGETTRAVQSYIVRSGDTIGYIAEQFGVSIYTILWANKLTLRSVLHAGQTINILPVSGVAHKVQSGDTVASLAKKYNADKDKIIAFNQMAYDQRLTAGEIIIIPGGEITAPPPPRPTFTQTFQLFTGPKNYPPPTGRLLWPVSTSHRITQYYSPRHTGIDIGANYLTPIMAADDGIIELVQFGRTGYGYQTIIDHENGYRTRYGHQSQIFVQPGERVTRGQTIGTIGSTGRSTGPHLHFEVYVNGRRTNPLPYVR